MSTAKSGDDRFHDLQRQIDELMGVLSQESDALSKPNVRQLDSVLNRKRVLLENLLEFAEGELAEENSGSPQWDAFVDKLSACRQQNLVNGATMSAMNHSRQRALRVLYGQNAEADSYGSSGRRSDTDQPVRDLGKA